MARRPLEKIFTFTDFLHERNGTYEHIKQFLTMVLKCCVHKEDVLAFEPHEIGLHLGMLLYSLRMAHAFYGYPTAKSYLDGDQLAFDHLVLNEIEVENKAGLRISFEHYGKNIRDGLFWGKENISESFSVESLPRGPAYYFLEMVRNLSRDESASAVAWNYLETLPDENYLKPAVWAEDANNPDKYFATSLAVPHHIRPLYLYAKLRDYPDVDACQHFRSMGRHRPYLCSRKLKTVDENPCTSCQIFFGKSHETKIERNMTYFGVCAEFYIIQTMYSQQKLRAIKESDHWRSFKSACENQLNAFSKLRNSVRKSQRLKRNDLLEYFETTRNTNQKTLQYKWIPSKNSYQLVTRDYKIKHEECGKSTPSKRQYPDGIDKQKHVKETEPLNNCLWINKRQRLKIMTLNAIQETVGPEDESDDGFESADIRYLKKLLDEKVLKTTAAMRKKRPAFFTRQHPNAIDKQQDESDDGFDTADVRYPETLLGEKVLEKKPKEYVDTGIKKSEGCAKSPLRKRQYPNAIDKQQARETAKKLKEDPPGAIGEPEDSDEGLSKYFSDYSIEEIEEAIACYDMENEGHHLPL